MKTAGIRTALVVVLICTAAPGYAEMISEAGFPDLVEFAHSRPHPGELLAAIPEELLSAIGLVGSKSEIEQKLEAYRQAGAAEVCLVPATAGDPNGIRTLQAMGKYLV